jgi:hypothetical protein
MNKSDVYYSAYERIPHDNYPTIDTRCVDGLLANIAVTGTIVDPWAAEGSAIVDYLVSIHKNAIGLTDSWADCEGDWLVGNPPYQKDEVYEHVEFQIERILEKKFYGFALLVRNQWAFAKTRLPLFQIPLYLGEIKLLFRTFWTNDRSAEPKHNYVWHIWQRDGWAYRRPMFYLPPYDERYAIKRQK